MKKSSALGMMLMMGAMMEGQNFNKETTKLPPKRKPIKKIIPKGLKEFFYGEKVIHALNKKNADRKALKQGLIIAIVIVPFYCVNKKVGYKDSICLDQCITCGMRDKAQ